MGDMLLKDFLEKEILGTAAANIRSTAARSPDSEKFEGQSRVSLIRSGRGMLLSKQFLKLRRCSFDVTLSPFHRLS